MAFAQLQVLTVGIALLRERIRAAASARPDACSLDPRHRRQLPPHLGDVAIERDLLVLHLSLVLLEELLEARVTAHAFLRLRDRHREIDEDHARVRRRIGRLPAPPRRRHDRSSRASGACGHRHRAGEEKPRSHPHSIGHGEIAMSHAAQAVTPRDPR